MPLGRQQGSPHRRELQHCCHPERSEGSLSGERSFAALRMTLLNRLASFDSQNVFFEMDCPLRSYWRGGSAYGSNSPRCTFARSLVQARAWRIEEGRVNVYGVSWSPPLLPPDSSCKSSRERVFQ